MQVTWAASNSGPVDFGFHLFPRAGWEDGLLGRFGTALVSVHCLSSPSPPHLASNFNSVNIELTFPKTFGQCHSPFGIFQRLQIALLKYYFIAFSYYDDILMALQKRQIKALHHLQITFTTFLFDLYKKISENKQGRCLHAHFCR